MSWRTEENLAWLQGLPGVEVGKSLARHTSFNIGGPADFLVESADVKVVPRKPPEKGHGHEHHEHAPSHEGHEHEHGEVTQPAQ